MKKIYSTPDFVITAIENEDILTVSGPGESIHWGEGSSEALW